ncbi:S8 family serine peptidase [Solirubrobacter phytolaccae]|uniref:S8 family serine peptidase n=1 Tax=Solirubrobacter phytolaccae TaxID=1404360 RepID=A0A9X3NE64_9ACTN|nr:S8 family peptidase [Solirubrobacter phytolaccae]MDA0182411.1 S8 family serine peptidase [Solirubrobacter phytolaccae]
MRRVSALIAVFLFAAPAAAHAGEGDIIVIREPGADARDIREDAGVRIVKPLGLEHAELVKPRDGDVAEAVTELRADDDVVLAEPDRRVSINRLDAPNDPYFASLWGLPDSAVPAAWTSTTGAGVTVGVVDTGVRADHLDLAGQLTGNPGEIGGGRETNGLDDDGNGLIDDFRGWDFISADNLPQDGNGHGTHVTGTIAALADNGRGVAGVAPGAKVVPLRALDNSGNGFMSTIASALDYAGDLGLPVVNASLGGGYSTVLERVVAAHPNTLYVVAAGNSNANNDDPAIASFPCALPQANVLCVAAHDRDNARASFSNYGATTVDLSAPGVSIVSTWSTGSNAYATTQGTSMASPHVAGAAADVLSARPGVTAAQLKWALTSSTDITPALVGTTVTGGRLDTAAAVAAINGTLPVEVAPPTPTVTPTPDAPVVTPPPPPPPVAIATPTPVVTPEPTPAEPASPRLTDVNVGGSLSGVKGKLRVSFKLTRSAKVRFAVHAKGKSKALATWTKQAHRGGNQFTLTRKLPTGKTLKRGAYTLSVSLSASAQSSTAIRVR